MRAMCSQYEEQFDPFYLSLDEAMRPAPTTQEIGRMLFAGGTAQVYLNQVNTIERGMFGLIPHWGDPKKLFRATYNAKTETVASKPSYRSAWKARRLCLVPMAAFFEPSYETGKPEWWRIARADHRPFCAAGIWEHRYEDQGPARWSFSLLTVNADGHALMKRFHKPGDEKRSIVVLDPEDYEGWLGARTDEEARSYFRLFEPDLMVATHDPRAPRRKAKAATGGVVSGDLLLDDPAA